MTGAEQLAVLLAGLGAGVLSSTVGVASLLSFPVLLAVGLPPVVANVSNTVGLTAGGASGAFGYRRELAEHPRAAVVVLTTCALGAVGGAALLLSLPGSVFEAVVPYLILFTCLLVGIQPRLSRLLRTDADRPAREHLSPATTVAATAVGVYGGYFGAGAGVMMVAVLGFGTDLELRVVNGLKTLSLLAGNVVASVVFLLVADVAWAAAGLLAAGSVVGGYVGARVGRRLPPTVFRVLVVGAGITAAVTMLG